MNITQEISQEAMNSKMSSLALETDAMGSEIYLALGLSELSKGIPEAPRVLSLLSLLLERYVQKNEKLMETTKKRGTITIFHGLRAPTLSIQQYIERIFKYSSCSPSCFVVAHIYLDRYLQKGDVYLTFLNVHRLLITSVMIAAKFVDDAFFNNAYYAKVGGVSTAEMNSLEMDFLFSLDFRLHVTVDAFKKNCVQLEKEASNAYTIEQPIQVCRLKEGWQSKGEAEDGAKFRRFSCGAV
ncbi:hypothetical protein Syun_007549 [Stephania yunnanensis]|uniref:Cyclin n=1 Tax=Stephania yunnanensis TaxID=152371 RepID=A0AAP0L066_9MAGN